MKRAAPASVAVRGGNGLGDAIYIQSIARWFLNKGHPVEVCTRWPDVFRQLAGNLTISEFRRERITNLAHYTSRKGTPGTSQFIDCCLQAGIREPIQLDLGWTPTSDKFTKVLSSGKPVIAVSLPRRPMGRTDGFGVEILPDCRALQAAIDAIAGRVLVVMVGAGTPLHKLAGIDIDLVDKTSVAELLDVATVCDGFLGYCSFLVPLAEAQDKPALWVWSRRGLTSQNKFVRNITPQKILHRAKSKHVVDDFAGERIRAAVDSLLVACSSRREVQG